MVTADCLVCSLAPNTFRHIVSSIQLRHLFVADCFEAPANSAVNMPVVRAGVKEIVSGKITAAALTYAGTTSVFSGTGQYLCTLNPAADIIVKCIWYSRRAASYILACVSMNDDCNRLYVYAIAEQDCILAGEMTVERPVTRQLNVGMITRPGYVEYDDVSDVLLAYEPGKKISARQQHKDANGHTAKANQPGCFRIFCYAESKLSCIVKLSADCIEDVRLSGQYLVATMAVTRSILYLKVMVLRPGTIVGVPYTLEQFISVRLKLPRASPAQFIEVMGSYLYVQQEGAPLLAINLISQEIYRYLVSTSIQDLPAAQLTFSNSGDYLALSSGSTLRVINVLKEEFTAHDIQKTKSIPVFWIPWFGVWFYHGYECTKDLGTIQGFYISDPTGTEKRLLMSYDSTYLTVLHVCDSRVYIGSSDGTFHVCNIS